MGDKTNQLSALNNNPGNTLGSRSVLGVKFFIGSKFTFLETVLWCTPNVISVCVAFLSLSGVQLFGDLELMDSYCHLKISVEITSKFCVVYCQVLLYLIMSDVCYVIRCNESLVALVGNVVY